MHARLHRSFVRSRAAVLTKSCARAHKHTHTHYGTGSCMRFVGGGIRSAVRPSWTYYAIHSYSNDGNLAVVDLVVVVEESSSSIRRRFFLTVSRRFSGTPQTTWMNGSARACTRTADVLVEAVPMRPRQLRCDRCDGRDADDDDDSEHQFCICRTVSAARTRACAVIINQRVQQYINYAEREQHINPRTPASTYHIIPYYVAHMIARTRSACGGSARERSCLHSRPHHPHIHTHTHTVVPDSFSFMSELCARFHNINNREGCTNATKRQSHGHPIHILVEHVRVCVARARS